jgi:transcriptional regulator with XRE-family HTH domain
MAWAASGTGITRVDCSLGCPARVRSRIGLSLNQVDRDGSETQARVRDGPCGHGFRTRLTHETLATSRVSARAWARQQTLWLGAGRGAGRTVGLRLPGSMTRGAHVQKMSLVTDPNTVSTGLPQLDAALGGLFRGDNVVWEFDEGGSLEPFVAALLRSREQFDRIVFVRFEGGMEGVRAAYPDTEVLDARKGSAIGDPGALLTAVREHAQVPHALVIFDPLDSLSARWGEAMTQRFFTRACPMLLDLWTVAYWSLTPSHHSAGLRQAVDAVTQCVLVLGGDRLRIAKAEGRPPGVQGSVFRLHPNGPQAELKAAPTAARLGAALRAIRIQRHLSQGELAELAGVSASAISQAERGRRGLALETLLELTSRLNMTIDELLRGDIALGYRLARRPGREHRADRLFPLLDDPRVGLRAQLSHLSPGRSARSGAPHDDVGLVAVAVGLVEVILPTGRPVLRQGEALLVERSGVVAWRNIGAEDALVFWILRDDPGPSRPPPRSMEELRSNGDGADR